ncbi:hypothetical protein D3C86_1703660 [compost metagenome]
MAPGRLQRGAEKWHQGGRHQRELAADQRNRPGLELPGVGIAQRRQGFYHRRLCRWRIPLQQRFEEWQPFALAHQAVGGERWKAMLLADPQAFKVRRCSGGWIVHQLLLDMAQAGHQPQVIGQGMPFGEPFQALCPQREQVVRWQVQKRRRTRRRFDVARLKNRRQGVILFC